MMWACIGRFNNEFHAWMWNLQCLFGCMRYLRKDLGMDESAVQLIAAADQGPLKTPLKQTSLKTPLKKTSLKTCQKCDGKNVEKSCLSSSCRGLHLDIKRIMYAPEHCSASPLIEILLEFTLLIFWELWVSSIYASKWWQLQYKWYRIEMSAICYNHVIYMGKKWLPALV